MGRGLGKKERLWIEQDNLNTLRFYSQYREISKERPCSIENLVLKTNTSILGFRQEGISGASLVQPLTQSRVSLKSSSGKKGISNPTTIRSRVCGFEWRRAFYMKAGEFLYMKYVTICSHQACSHLAHATISPNSHR